MYNKILINDNHLNQLKKIFNDNVTRIEKSLLLIDYIRDRSNYKNEFKKGMKMIRISRMYMRELVGGTYTMNTEIIESLIKSKILKRDNSYYCDINDPTNSQSMKYGLKREFLIIDDNMNEYELTRQNHIEKYNNPPEFKRELSDEEIYLENKLINLRIDYDKVDNRDKRRSQMINNGRFGVHKVSTGRIFTRFTNISKDSRKHIYNSVSGRNDWVMVDVKNSQPFEVAIMMKGDDHFMKNKDIQRFVDKCLNGEIYDEVGKVIRSSRKEVKMRFMDTLLNTRDHKQYLMKEKKNRQLNKIEREQLKFIKKFRTKYPNVVKWLWRKKKQYPKNNIGFTRDLQRRESNMVIRKVAYELAHITNIITIHDCIIVHPEYLNDVIYAFNKCYNIEYGVTPPIDVEYINIQSKGNYKNEQSFIKNKLNELVSFFKKAV